MIFQTYREIIIAAGGLTLEGVGFGKEMSCFMRPEFANRLNLVELVVFGLGRKSVDKL